MSYTHFQNLMLQELMAFVNKEKLRKFKLYFSYFCMLCYLLMLGARVAFYFNFMQ